MRDRAVRLGDELGADPALFGLELLKRDGRGVGQMGAHQGRAFRLEPVTYPPGADGGLLPLSVQPVDRRQQPLADSVGGLGVELQAPPVVGDGVLDPLGQDVSLLAAVSLLVPPDAEEVEVGALGTWSGRAGCRTSSRRSP